MLFSFDGIDWSDTRGRTSFWLDRVAYDQEQRLIYFYADMNNPKVYPFFRNYHNGGIKEFIGDCLKSQGIDIYKRVNGRSQLSSTYGAFKDFKTIPPDIKLAFAYSDLPPRFDILFKTPDRLPGNIDHFNSSFVASLHDRVEIRHSLITKIQCSEFLL